MKKLMILEVRRVVTKSVALKLISCAISIHFAMNPIEGGRPERFEDTTIGTQEGSLFISFKLFLIFEILISHIVMITDDQYRITKIMVIFMLDKIAISIHLRLNTEDSAIYSINFCLLSCDSDPVIRLITILVKTNPFEMKIDR